MQDISSSLGKNKEIFKVKELIFSVVENGVSINFCGEGFT